MSVVRIAGRASALQAALGPREFPGRWNPLRAIPPEAEPAATAAAAALEDAGWWKRGTGAACAGGLVFASDGASRAPAARFAARLREDLPSAVGPGDFLFALPSTVAAVLGILFGLTEYQATIAGGPASSDEAVEHARDLIEIGRLDRILVVSLAVDGAAGLRRGEAWALTTERNSRDA